MLFPPIIVPSYPLLLIVSQQAVKLPRIGHYQRRTPSSPKFSSASPSPNPYPYPDNKLSYSISLVLQSVELIVTLILAILPFEPPQLLPSSSLVGHVFRWPPLSAKALILIAKNEASSSSSAFSLTLSSLLSLSPPLFLRRPPLQHLKLLCHLSLHCYHHHCHTMAKRNNVVANTCIVLAAMMSG